MREKKAMQVVFIVFLMNLTLFSCEKVEKVSPHKTPHLKSTTKETDMPVAKDYNINSPEKIWELPFELKEISGMAVIDDNTIACIQDESGIIFKYGLEEEKIIETLKFAKSGDYEGIALKENIFYVLRSDGRIYKVDPAGKKIKVKDYHSKTPAQDIEGLCYDKVSDKLLIAAKSSTKDDKKDKKPVFAFDIDKHKSDKDAAFFIDYDELSDIAKESDVKIKKIKKFNLQCSAIAVHPLTNDYYILSANDYILISIGRSGSIKTVYKLDKNIFPQAEGLAFLGNGDMLISNEGRSGAANILKFGFSKE